MSSLAALALLCQFLEPVPKQAEVGDSVRVELRGVEPQRRSGQLVDLHRPDGTTQELGPTNADGAVHFVPDVPGDYSLHTEVDGVLLLTPFRAVERPRRWLYALWCLPAGLVLLGLNAAGLRRDRRGARRSGPSRPSP